MRPAFGILFISCCARRSEPQTENWLPEPRSPDAALVGFIVFFIGFQPLCTRTFTLYLYGLVVICYHVFPYVSHSLPLSLFDSYQQCNRFDAETQQNAYGTGTTCVGVHACTGART